MESTFSNLFKKVIIAGYCRHLFSGVRKFFVYLRKLTKGPLKCSFLHDYIFPDNSHIHKFFYNYATSETYDLIAQYVYAYMYVCVYVCACASVLELIQGLLFCFFQNFAVIICNYLLFKSQNLLTCLNA